ncbi:MAG: sodium:alanine symporter family protein [bacterium]
MLDLLTAVNAKANSLVWGPPMLAALLGVGLYYSMGTRLVQFAKLGASFRETFGRMFDREGGKAGDVTPFQAVTVAMGGTVGVGNIAGVATAIALGGPGAVFWMWVSGFLGMATKFGEVALGIHYRVREEGGPMAGGPMHYIKRGMGGGFTFLAATFSFFGALAALGIGNMVQSNSVAEGFAKFGVPRIYTGLFLVVAVGLVTVGGIKRIAQVAMVFVPFMCVLYFLGCLGVIVYHAAALPAAFALIFSRAFTPAAAAGGFAGATMMQALRYGVARGVFSNEAGLGSAPIAHATAMTPHPVAQGMWGVMEVFIDTIVICTATALAIMASGTWTSGKTGAELTMLAFDRTYAGEIGSLIVAVSMIMTAYDTNLAWCFYGETCASFLFGKGSRPLYRVLWLPFVAAGAIWKLETVWNVSDTLNGLMAIPNLIALFALGGVVFRLTGGYFGKNAEK